MTVTAKDVRAALDKRYGQTSQGRDAEAWIRIHEARAGAGFDGNTGQCDYLAINTWKSRGLQLIGHEIKVSLSDWRAELANPAKADRFARYCRRWWVAAPSDIAAKIKPELPPTWGLLAVSDKLTCREVVAAPAHQPETVPEWWWIGWLAQVDRRHTRAAADELTRRVNAEVERLRPSIEQSAARGIEHTRAELRTLNERIRHFAAATGFDVRQAWGPDVTRLGQVYAAVKRSLDFGAVANHLRSALEALDVFAELTEAQP